MVSADVSAPLTFIIRSDKKPVFHSASYTGDVPRVFFDTERRPVRIQDMRPLVDALSHLGVRHVEMPATPKRLWRVIQGASVG